MFAALTPSWRVLWFPEYGQWGSRAWTSQWGIGCDDPWWAPGRTLGTKAAIGHSTAEGPLRINYDKGISRLLFRKPLQQYSVKEALCKTKWYSRMYIYSYESLKYWLECVFFFFCISMKVISDHWSWEDGCRRRSACGSPLWPELWGHPGCCAGSS